MKIFYILLFTLNFYIITLSQPINVMTYNIRLNLASDNDNAWPLRKEEVAGLITFHEPDIFGVQEALPEQMEYLDSVLTDYKFVGYGRDGGKMGEHSSIFFKTNGFSVIYHSTFWLSETPEVSSMGWDAAYPRICTYALFQEKSTLKYFWVFNLHLDHVGIEARRNGTLLVLDSIKQKNPQNFPVILMGDFNALSTDEPIQLVTEQLTNSMNESMIVYSKGGTFNGFNFHQPANDCIDYIFITPKKFKVLKYGILTDSFNCHYPSDHFPVWVSLEWN